MNKVLTLCLLVSLFACQNQKFDLVIRNAVIYDGSGSQSIKGDVGINSDTIAAVGDLSKAEAGRIVDINGLALSPGFIDTHSHHDRGLNESREALAAVSRDHNDYCGAGWRLTHSVERLFCSPEGQRSGCECRIL